mgnify:CR=1 FL=1
MKVQYLHSVKHMYFNPQDVQKDILNMRVRNQKFDTQ